MPLDIPENYLQVSIPFDYGGGNKTAITTIGVYDVNSVLTPVETVDVVIQAFLDTCASFIDAGVAIGPGIGLAEIGGGNYGTVAGTVSGAGGRSSDDTVSPAIALLVRKTTSRVGRGGRGRMFIPWAMDDDDVDEAGAVLSGIVSSRGAVIGAWAQEMIDNGAIPVLLHNKGIPGGSTPTLINDFVVDDEVATQRRRQRR